MNMQEALDKAAEHLRVQGKRAVGRLGACKNLDDQGNKCAVACLLTPEELAQCGTGNWSRAEAIMVGHGLPRQFVQCLRAAHDDCIDGDFRPGLAAVAEQFGLRFEPWITPQEALDKVAAHLRRQRKRAMDDGACTNLAPDGSKCALACLLTEEELGRCGNGIGAARATLTQVRKLPMRLLDSLQLAHDHAIDNKFKARLKRVAESHGLEWRHG